METPFCVSNYSNNNNNSDSSSSGGSSNNSYSHSNERTHLTLFNFHAFLTRSPLPFWLLCYYTTAAAVAAFSKSIIAVTIIMIITIIVLCSFFCHVQSLFVLIKSCVCVQMCTKQIHCLTYCLFFLVLFFYS